MIVKYFYFLSISLILIFETCLILQIIIQLSLNLFSKLSITSKTERCKLKGGNLHDPDSYHLELFYFPYGMKNHPFWLVSWSEQSFSLFQNGLGPFVFYPKVKAAAIIASSHYSLCLVAFSPLQVA